MSYKQLYAVPAAKFEQFLHGKDVKFPNVKSLSVDQLNFNEADKINANFSQKKPKKEVLEEKNDDINAEKEKVDNLNNNNIFPIKPPNIDVRVNTSEPKNLVAENNKRATPKREDNSSNENILENVREENHWQKPPPPNPNYYNFFNTEQSRENAGQRQSLHYRPSDIPNRSLQAEQNENLNYSSALQGEETFDRVIPQTEQSMDEERWLKDTSFVPESSFTTPVHNPMSSSANAFGSSLRLNPQLAAVARNLANIKNNSPKLNVSRNLSMSEFNSPKNKTPEQKSASKSSRKKSNRKKAVQLQVKQEPNFAVSPHAGPLVKNTASRLFQATASTRNKAVAPQNRQSTSTRAGKPRQNKK